MHRFKGDTTARQHRGLELTGPQVTAYTPYRRIYRYLSRNVYALIKSGIARQPDSAEFRSKRKRNSLGDYA